MCVLWVIENSTVHHSFLLEICNCTTCKYLYSFCGNWVLYIVNYLYLLYLFTVEALTIIYCFEHMFCGVQNVGSQW
jgi:hypothetical protein